MIEALMVVAIGLLLAGLAIPIFTNAMKNYYQAATVSAAAGAIQSTRFQAIMRGYPYQITFTSSTKSYQLYAEAAGVTCPPTFSAVGTATPLPSAGGVSLTGTTVTFTFYGSGTVYGSVPTASPCLPTAAPTLQIANSVKSNTITVSGVGNVTTASP
jgi:Tfp pilus assembly protein FimT